MQFSASLFFKLYIYLGFSEQINLLVKYVRSFSFTVLETRNKEQGTVNTIQYNTIRAFEVQSSKLFEPQTNKLIKPRTLNFKLQTYLAYFPPEHGSTFNTPFV